MSGLLNLKTTPADLNAFAKKVDENLRNKNIYYDDLITGNILQPLKISTGQKKWIY